MSFEEILPHIKSGKKVYRREWHEESNEAMAYIILSDRGARYLYLYEYGNLVDSAYNLSGYDVTSDDWEIFFEKSC